MKDKRFRVLSIMLIVAMSFATMPFWDAAWTGGVILYAYALGKGVYDTEDTEVTDSD